VYLLILNWFLVCFFLEGMIVQHIRMCIYVYIYIYIYIYGEPRTVNTVNITKVLVLILFPATTKARNQQHSMETTYPLHGKLEHHLPYIPQCLCSAGWNGLYMVFAPKILGVWLYIVPPVRNRLLMNCSRNWSFQRKKHLSICHSDITWSQPGFWYHFWIYFSAPGCEKTRGKQCKQSYKTWGFLRSILGICRFQGINTPDPRSNGGIQDR